MLFRSTVPASYTGNKLYIEGSGGGGGAGGPEPRLKYGYEGYPGTRVGGYVNVVPGDVITMHIGGGGQGGADKAASGGGAYAKSTTMTGLAAGLTVYYQVGAVNTSSWFSLTNSAPTANLSSGTTGVLAASEIGRAHV